MFYSPGGTPSTRDGQVIANLGRFATRGVLKQCSAGYFGSNLGQVTKECSGECEPGWYCPQGSQSPRQVACGSENVYCPKGSASPQQVQEGYYTTSQEDEPCPPGTYREDETAGASSRTGNVSDARTGHSSTCPETMQVFAGSAGLLQSIVFSGRRAIVTSLPPTEKWTHWSLMCCWEPASRRLSTPSHPTTTSHLCLS